jgi:heterodisulfide reductase subunit C2
MKKPVLFNEEDLYECYQCARCTGSCPAAMVVEGFNPRNLLLKCLRLGLDSAISDEKLWCCTTCGVCEDRCPQMLDVADLLVKLMNEAAQNGHIPEKVRLGTEMVIKTGRVVLMSKRIDQVRSRLGLKPLPEVPVEEVEAILEQTGLAGLIG